MLSLHRISVPLVSLILILQIAVYYTWSRKEVIPETKPWSEFPETIGPWKAVSESQMPEEVFERLRPDDYLHREYRSGAEQPPANLFIGYFKTRRGGYAPHSPKDCLPGAGWIPVSSSVMDLPVDEQSGSIPLNHFVVEKSGVQWLVLFWYHQDGKIFANELKAQFFSVPQLLFHGRTDIALVRLIVPVIRGDLKDTEALAYPLAKSIFGLVQSHIP